MVRSQVHHYDVLPAESTRQPGIFRFTDDQMRVVATADLPFRDCRLVDEDGRYTYELYVDGPQRVPMMAVAVQAASQPLTARVDPHAPVRDPPLY